MTESQQLTAVFIVFNVTPSRLASIMWIRIKRNEWMLSNFVMVAEWINTREEDAAKPSAGKHNGLEGAESETAKRNIKHCKENGIINNLEAFEFVRLPG